MDFNASGDGDEKISRNSKEQGETFGFPFQNGQSSSSPHKNGSKKPASGIPRLRVKKKGSADSGKSVIYGPMSHSLKNKAKNGFSSSMKGPWVPAPAKSTTGIHVNQKNKNSPRLYSAPLDFNSSLRDEDETSNIFGSIASYPIDIRNNKVLGTSKFRFKSRSSCSSNSPDRKSRISSLNKKSKRKVRISSSGYTLKSKDSLIDVTAFLHSKREEIMRLWEHYLTGGNDELLSTFQEANRLALEAANEVETLRKSIQELHKKDSSLSESDCDLLDKLRNQVLGKIKEFENANSKVQDHVSKTVFQDSNATKTIKDKPKSLPNVGKSKSMSSISKHNVNVNNVNEEEVVFIKQKSSAFEIPQLSESEISDNDKFYNEFKVINNTKRSDEQGNQAKANPSQSNTTAKTNPSTIVDLSKLTRLYEEQYEMPPVNFTSEKEQVVTTDVAHSSRSVRFHHTTANNDECDIQVLKNQIDSLIKVLGSKKENLVAARKASKSESFYDNSSSSPERESDLNPKLYKEKVQQLEAQLLDAETEMVQLKDELERVESESNYQVRRLQSNFEDRLETLENFPEYLEFSEQKLLRSLQEKTKLEATIEVKDKEIEKLKDSNKRLSEKMEKANGEMANFEKLRLEMDTKDKEIAKLSSKLETMDLNRKCFNQGSVSTKHYYDNQDRTLKHVIKKNEKLELKIDELRNSLAKAAKNIHIVQVSKEKMMARMTLRQEDILSELEQTREKNRKLKNQIHLIRSKYHELFPFGMLNIRANNELSKPEGTKHNVNLKSPSSQKRKKEKEKGQKSQFQMHKPVVDEPLINQIKTWITGNTEDDKGTFVLESGSENEKWADLETEQRRN